MAVQTFIHKIARFVILVKNFSDPIITRTKILFPEAEAFFHHHHIFTSQWHCTALEFWPTPSLEKILRMSMPNFPDFLPIAKNETL